MPTGTGRRSKRVGWGIGAVVLALLGAAVAGPTAAAAAVEPGDDVYIGHKLGYGGTGLFAVWSDAPADPATATPELWAYCIEHDVSAETLIEGRTGLLEDFLGDNHLSDPTVQGKVLWVLGHSYPALSLADFGTAAGVPGISRDDAIEAAQYAIWRYTELDFDAAWNWETPDSEAAYWYLVGRANAAPGATPGELEATVDLAAPAAAQTAGSLVGPFVVHTDRPSAQVAVAPAIALVDAAGTPVDADAVVDGQSLYLDLRGSAAAGSATITASVAGSGATGRIVSVPTAPGGTPTTGDHAQSIILVAPDTAMTTASASAAWSAVPAAPAIATTLVDSADGDHVLAWDGGTVVDTVAYQGLVPGTTYTVRGELVRKPDASGTGITGSTTFTPTASDGTVEVTFAVPAGHAGEVLVAYEEVFDGTAPADGPVAVHEDVDDAAQTVVVDAAPAGATPPAPEDGVTPPATEDGATPPATDGSAAAGTGSGDRLAETGIAPPAGAAAVAALAVLAGAILTAIRRRRRA